MTVLLGLIAKNPANDELLEQQQQYGEKNPSEPSAEHLAVVVFLLEMPFQLGIYVVDGASYTVDLLIHVSMCLGSLSFKSLLPRLDSYQASINLSDLGLNMAYAFVVHPAPSLLI